MKEKKLYLIVSTSIVVLAISGTILTVSYEGILHLIGAILLAISVIGSLPALILTSVYGE